MGKAKTLIRLGGCPGWSESSPKAHATLLVLSCRGSILDLMGWLVGVYGYLDLMGWFLQIFIWAASCQNQQNDLVPSKDSDQHRPSLIRVFAVRLKKARILSYPLSAQRRLWSDWADAQADLSLHWVHMPFRRFCHMQLTWVSISPSELQQHRSVHFSDGLGYHRPCQNQPL